MFLITFLLLLSAEELILTNGKIIKCKSFETKGNSILVHTDKVFSIPKRLVDWDRMELVKRERARIRAHREKVAQLINELEYPTYDPLEIEEIAGASLDRTTDQLLEAARNQPFKGALAYYRLAEAGGSVPAAFYLGNAYLSKDDKAKARQRAVVWLEKAAKAQYHDAQFTLGMLYINGFDVTLNDLATDFNRGRHLLEAAARGGHQAAAVELGSIYTSGRASAGDLKTVLPWIEASAETDVTSAQYQLGVIYAEGASVPRDLKLARKWMSRAAENDYQPAMYYLGAHLMEPKAGLKMVRRAAEKGSRAAQNHLGEVYREGKLVDRDMEEAVVWFTKAAHRHPPALNNLGLCYWNGEGVVEDQEEARRWFLKAAQLNHPDAFNNLGLFYSDEGSEFYDAKEALNWFGKAAVKDHPAANYYLAELYRQGNGVEKNEDKAMSLYQNAASLGFEPAAAVVETWESWGSPEFVARRKARMQKNKR